MSEPKHKLPLKLEPGTDGSMHVHDGDGWAMGCIYDTDLAKLMVNATNYHERLKGIVSDLAKHDCCCGSKRHGWVCFECQARNLQEMEQNGNQ